MWRSLGSLLNDLYKSWRCMREAGSRCRREGAGRMEECRRKRAGRIEECRELYRALL